MKWDKHSGSSSIPGPKNRSARDKQAGEGTVDYIIPISDPVDEAAQESFPASDPPTFSGASVTPSTKSASSKCAS
jgi:hypothetical protein